MGDVPQLLLPELRCPVRGPSNPGSGTLSGDVGRIKRDDGKYQCKACEQSFDLKSNRAIRQIARYFLSLSLPYADCTTPPALNHGANVFEHYTRPGVHVGPWPHQLHPVRSRRGDATGENQSTESSVEDAATPSLSESPAGSLKEMRQRHSARSCSSPWPGRITSRTPTTWATWG